MIEGARQDWSARLAACAIGCLSLVGCGGGSSGGNTGGSAGSNHLGGAGGTVSSGQGGTAGGISGTGGTSTGGSAGHGGAPGTGGAGGIAGRGGSGGSGGVGGAFQAAQHPALPQVVNLGGAVLTAPKVLPILYGSDKSSTDIKAFLAEYASSPAWAAQTKEYGVGALTILPAVTISGTAPATVSDTTLLSMLGSNTSGANPAWGALDPGTIYMFVMPDGTLESVDKQACCSDFDGYHSDAQIGSKVVPYALICACPATAQSQITELQDRTVSISHELVEAATDPYPNTDPAFVQEDDANIVWTLVTDGEAADMCEFNDDANITPSGAKYMIQRTWSNAAAARGENPCVPATTTTPYLNTFPALTQISAPALGPGFSTLGLNIPIGQKTTIPLTLSSTGPTSADWKVQVFDYDQTVAGAAAGLSLSLDKTSGRNGDTLHLTITPKVADPQLGGEAFIIVSTYGAPGDPGYQTELTMGLVTN